MDDQQFWRMVEEFLASRGMAGPPPQMGSEIGVPSVLDGPAPPYQAPANPTGGFGPPPANVSPPKMSGQQVVKNLTQPRTTPGQPFGGMPNGYGKPSKAPGATPPKPKLVDPSTPKPAPKGPNYAFKGIKTPGGTTTPPRGMKP